MNKYEKAIKSLLESGVDIVSMICYVSEPHAKKQEGYPIVVLKVEIDNILWNIDTITVPADFLPNDMDYMILESGTNYEQGLTKWIEYMEANNEPT